jgi:hypothetical protein
VREAAVCITQRHEDLKVPFVDYSGAKSICGLEV